MAPPPEEAGAVHVTVAEPFPETEAETLLGAEATAGLTTTLHVTAADADEADEFPPPFTATTVNVTGTVVDRSLITVDKTFPTVTGLPDEGVTI